MAAVQLMCARLGLVTGRGLAGVVRRQYPRAVLWGACVLLIVANVFNIGADLGGMAEATEMMTGIKSHYWTPVYTILVVSLLFFSSYRHIARIFKWLTLVLFSYIAAAFLARPDWGSVLSATLVPRVEWSSAFLATLVGILGTTISPYLFFWQASQEVEDERAQGRRTVGQRQPARGHRHLSGTSMRALLDIRIGTMIKANAPDPAAYVRQIVGLGFESIEPFFWQTMNKDLPLLAKQLREAIGAADVDDRYARHVRQSARGRRSRSADACAAGRR